VPVTVPLNVVIMVLVSRLEEWFVVLEVDDEVDEVGVTEGIVGVVVIKIVDCTVVTVLEVVVSKTVLPVVLGVMMTVEVVLVLDVTVGEEELDVIEPVDVAVVVIEPVDVAVVVIELVDVAVVVIELVDVVVVVIGLVDVAAVVEVPLLLLVETVLDLEVVDVREADATLLK
jgi:hypothetical protein